MGKHAFVLPFLIIFVCSATINILFCQRIQKMEKSIVDWAIVPTIQDRQCEGEHHNLDIRIRRWESLDGLLHCFLHFIKFIWSKPRLKPMKSWCDMVWIISFDPNSVIDRSRKSIDLKDNLKESDVLKLKSERSHRTATNIYCSIKTRE